MFHVFSFPVFSDLQMYTSGKARHRRRRSLLSSQSPSASRTASKNMTVLLSRSESEEVVALRRRIRHIIRGGPARIRQEPHDGVLVHGRVQYEGGDPFFRSIMTAEG